MTDPSTTTITNAPTAPPSTTYAGYTRFELELEFLSLLSSPLYLNHLASQKLLTHRPFIAYLKYLHSYWRRPEYVRFVRWPAGLRGLELLVEGTEGEGFREGVLRPGIVGALGGEWVGMEGEGEGGK
ncbi:Mediator of RNA polymerase II transcription subunit 31 [Lecanora helva]